MCASCGFPAAPGHWTEAGAATPHDRLRARFRRAAVLNRVLAGSGIGVHDDGQVPGIQVSAPGGGGVIVPDLAALWAEVARLRGRPFDPLEA